jgi:thiol-disulfide isomerase/thioredoxin
MKFRRILSLVISGIALLGNSKAQTKFTVRIIFPSSIKLNKINIEYHNGFKILPFSIDSTNRTIKLTGVFYSKYPQLIISYTVANNEDLYQKKYFLEKNASLIFYNNSKKNLDSVKLANAFDVMDTGEKRFNRFAKKELQEIKDFLVVNKKYINDSELVYRQFIKLAATIQKKKLEFIQINNKLFYSLWSFREEFVSNTDYKADSLLGIYNKYLSPAFSYTFESKQIISVLNGRLNSFEGKTAPLFSAKDIHGNRIDLSEFNNKKYVLLNFWATWCGPCIAEFPMLDSIHRNYSKNDIVIISVSEDRNEEKCLRAIQKLQMNWINIINDPVIEAAYGNNPALPQVYLIDKKGKIIYSRTEAKDYELKKLLSIVQKL